MKLSQIWRLFEIIKQILGLVKQAEDVVQDKPVSPAIATSTPVVPSSHPRDETDSKNEYHLNQ